jgi:hypothetical protein
VDHEALPAHGVAEAYLYLMATSCDACGKGPLRADEPDAATPPGGDAVLSLSVRCGACGRDRVYTFAVPRGPTVARDAALFEVNPTTEPSRILDVGQWIMLHLLHAESARHESNKHEARGMRLRAGQCLEEALKFYSDGDNDLPPPDAFFCESSRRRFRDHPERFSRRRIINLRRRLPTAARSDIER